MRCSPLIFAVAALSSAALASQPTRLLPRQATPSPTGRGACVQSGDSWVCELASAFGAPATTTTATTSSSVAAAAAEASPTGQGACELHDDHWHCEEESTDSHAGHDHSGHDHSGHNHAGHSHGPSAEYGCGLAPLEDYDMPLHIASVFILLVASLVGVLVPFFGVKIPHILFAMRYFGGGIILSTAFIHLLFHAFIYFANECIGTITYEPTSPAIAMAAVYIVFLLEFLVLRPFRRRALPPTSSDSSLERTKEDPFVGSSNNSVAVEAEERLAKYNVFALEAGIVFHSIIIGVTLGSSGGDGWVALLIAFTFHQLCEAIGLASRIVLLPSSKWSKFWMCVAFCLTTSVGIAIGIGVRNSFNGNARGTLLTIGILNSLSAGILLYSALVQIIVHDFIANREMLNASYGRCALAVGYFTLGILVMSILGYWA